MRQYISRKLLCQIIREAVGVKWDYIDSVKRRKKRGKGRIKRRHETRLKWSLYTDHYHRLTTVEHESQAVLRQRLIALAIKLGLKYYDRFEPGAWWGYVVIYVPNRLKVPEQHDLEYRPEFMIPEDYYSQ